MTQTTIEQRIGVKAKEAIEKKVFPGCVVGFIRKSGEMGIFPFGTFTYEEESPKVQEDSIYDLASITKSIPTASLALMLIDEKRLDLEDKLIKYLPEFANSDRENVLIKHLLTYTLDGYSLASVIDGEDGKSLHKRTTADFFNVLFTHDFERRPGEIFRYSNIPTALLGLVIENITGETLDVLADKHIFKPLGMNRTTFFPEKFSLDEIVPTEIDNWRGTVRGVVHDESAYICKKENKIVGHAGLFSTAGDILTFLEMLLNQGILRGQKYFSEDIVQQMHTNQISQLNDFTGLGWELNQPRYMSASCTQSTFGKTGFTGTLCVCDIEKEIAYVILSNRIFPKRPQDSSLINAFRASVGEVFLDESN